MSISHCTSLETAHLSSSSENSDILEDVIHTKNCVVYLQPTQPTSSSYIVYGAINNKKGGEIVLVKILLKTMGQWYSQLSYSISW